MQQEVDLLVPSIGSYQPQVVRDTLRRDAQMAADAEGGGDAAAAAAAASTEAAAADAAAAAAADTAAALDVLAESV